MKIRKMKIDFNLTDNLENTLSKVLCVPFIRSLQNYTGTIPLPLVVKLDDFLWHHCCNCNDSLITSH